MGIHDWSRVGAGLFHHFHQHWTAELCFRFNTGGLPKGYYALIQQSADFAIPDVLAFEKPNDSPSMDARQGSMAIATALPKTRFVMQAETELYTSRANRITHRHPLGDVVAVMEIVSPGNKDSRHALKDWSTSRSDC